MADSNHLSQVKWVLLIYTLVAILVVVSLTTSNRLITYKHTLYYGYSTEYVHKFYSLIQQNYCFILVLVFVLLYIDDIFSNSSAYVKHLFFKVDILTVIGWKTLITLIICLDYDGGFVLKVSLCFDGW